MRASAIVGRAALIGLGAVAATAALKASRRVGKPEQLERTNFHGRTVTLAGGPALAVAATATSAIGAPSGRLAAASLLAGGASGAVGLYDDIVGARPDQKSAKGFRGHVSALRDGKITSGLVKIAGVGAAALGASALVEADSARPRGRTGRLLNVLLGAGVIAGAANLINLLDLRPGRALKAGLIVSAPLLGGEAGGLLAGPVGAVAALLPADLDEQIMLGDTGANSLGALIGLRAIANIGPARRAALLAGLAALTAASERVSFTKVIESTPGLRELDQLGRRSDHARTGSDALRDADEPPRFIG